MKFIIIGLGNFGASLAQKLVAQGHEVIGVDTKMEKVEAMKEKITHTLCIDSTDPQAVKKLPLIDTDVVMVCIGENEGANLMATALMKQMGVKRLISRAVSPLHETILEAMQVSEIVHPEQETAERWAKKLNINNVVDSFELAGDSCIIEASVPKRFAGKTLGQLGFRKNYDVTVLTTIKKVEQRNLIGIPKKVSKTQGVASADTVLEEGDIMVLYGDVKDIERLMEED